MTDDVWIELFYLVIATLIQYCMNRAAHWERKFTISENISVEVKRRQKRLKKEGKTEEDIAEQVGIKIFKIKWKYFYLTYARCDIHLYN